VAMSCMKRIGGDHRVDRRAGAMCGGRKGIVPRRTDARASHRSYTPGTRAATTNPDIALTSGRVLSVHIGVGDLRVWDTQPTIGVER